MDTRLQNLELHIKAMDERCQMMQNKILDNAKLTPDEICELRLKQHEYQQSLTWLLNIKLNVFPPRIVPLNNN